MRPADGAQATSDLQIHGLKSIAKELSEVSKVIKAETKHSRKRIRTHHSDPNQRANETRNSADAIQIIRQIATSQRGERVCAPATASGNARRMEKQVARTAIWIVSSNASRI